MSSESFSSKLAEIVVLFFLSFVTKLALAFTVHLV